MRRAAIVLLLAFASAPAAAADRILNVEIVGPEAAAHEGITIEIRLADVTDPAVEPTILGGTSTSSGDYALPREMRIGFDAADLVAGRTYGIEARVWQGRALLFVTLEPLVVDPLTDETVAVRVDPPLPLALAGTRWIGEDFGGTMLRADGNPWRAALTFWPTDSALSTRFDVTGPCGDWVGTAQFAGIRLAFTDVDYLSRQCDGDPAAFAERVGGVVDATRTYVVEDGVLELRDAEGNVLGRLTPFVMPEN